MKRYSNVFKETNQVILVELFKLTKYNIIKIMMKKFANLLDDVNMNDRKEYMFVVGTNQTSKESKIRKPTQK